MKREAAIFGVVLALGVPAVWAEDFGLTRAPTQKLTGKVVSVVCELILSQSADDAARSACAAKTAQAGQPLGLKVNDKLYVAIMASMQPSQDALTKVMGQEVTAEGHVLETDGQRIIALTKLAVVKKAAPAPTPEAKTKEKAEPVAAKSEPIVKKVEAAVKAEVGQKPAVPAAAAPAAEPSPGNSIELESLEPALSLDTARKAR